MAAAVIPLIGALAPSVISIIQTILQVEKDKGSGNGLDKFKAVLAALMGKLTGIAPPGSTINQDAISGQIQGFVDILNSMGVLKGNNTNVDGIMQIVQLLLSLGKPVSTPQISGLTKGTVFNVKMEIL